VILFWRRRFFIKLFLATQAAFFRAAEATKWSSSTQSKGSSAVFRKVTEKSDL
jgi:hypothetical protein